MVVTCGSETAKTLSQVMRLLTEGLMDETFREVSAHGERLTSSQYEVLRYIDRHELPTVGEVAEGLGISSAAATKAVAGLSERAEPLVSRMRPHADRRRVRLATTQAGAELARRVREEFTHRLESILEQMPADRRRQLSEGLLAFLQAALLRPCDCDAACLRCGLDHTDDCVVHVAELVLCGQPVAPR